MDIARYINAVDFDILPSIIVAETPVRFMTEIKYFGISSNLSWDKQVNNVTKKIRAVLYQLKLCRHLLPESFRIRLAVALVLPHLDNCCTSYTDMTLEQDVKLRNKCLSQIRQYSVRCRFFSVDL